MLHYENNQNKLITRLVLPTRQGGWETIGVREMKQGTPMEKTPIDPFCPHGDVDQVACINNWMQFAELADHYIRSGDTLVAAALADHMLLDVHVQPACFLYRHGLELNLKDLAWKSQYLVTGKKRFAEKNWKELGQHRLIDIWDGAKIASKTVLRADFPLDSSKEKKLRSFLTQIEEHDPDSYSFRYPISKKKGRTHPKLNNVNLATLKAEVHNAFDQIKGILDMIDYCLSSER